jgi:hypothetical protein
MSTVRQTFQLACPKCGSDEHLCVAIETWANLSADGTDPVGDHDWNQYSGCRCTSCEFAGAIENFRVEPDAQPPPLKTFHVSFWEYDKYYAAIQALDADHAQRLAKEKLQRGSPDDFDIIKNVREDFDIEEAVS